MGAIKLPETRTRKLAATHPEVSFLQDNVHDELLERIVSFADEKNFIKP
jgi:hypothetical protein